MAKILEGSDHISEMFENHRKECNIPMFVEFRYLNCPTQKVVYKISKLNPSLELITEGVNFVITVNEEVFDKLNEPQQKILVSECLSGVRVNENDVVSLESPEFTTHTSTLKKFGHVDVIETKETVDLIYKQMKDKADEEKANSEPKKKGRPART
jgi:hypothetical protein